MVAPGSAALAEPDVPLDSNQAATGEDVLAVELPDDLDLTDFKFAS